MRSTEQYQVLLIPGMQLIMKRMITHSTNQALNIGLEKKIDKNFSIYGNYSESFRIPNIDERILATTSGSFAFKDQESDGIEIGVIYSNEVKFKYKLL